MSLKFNSPVCTRLSEIWTNTKTETEFPVDTGTTITVSCQEGYINTGSKIVTCNTYLYQDFQYNTEPNCTRTVGKYLTVLTVVSRTVGVNLQITNMAKPGTIYVILGLTRYQNSIYQFDRRKRLTLRTVA